MPHKKHKDLEVNIEKEVESTYIEVTAKYGKKIIVGNLYRALNSGTAALPTHLQQTVDTMQLEKGNKSVILGMKHNLGHIILG